MDEFVRDHPDMLVLISAGNSGRSGPRTVTPPGTAKNCLTVGAAKSVWALPGTATLNNNPQDDDDDVNTPLVNVPLSLSDFHLHGR